MSVASGFVITATVVGLTVGAVTALQPKTAAEVHRQQVEQLSDAQEEVHRRAREDAQDLGEADRRDRLRPGEHRPPEPPNVRVRLR